MKSVLLLIPLLLCMVVHASYVSVVTINIVKDGEPVRAYIEIYDSNSTMIYNGTVNGQIILYNISEGDYKVYVFHEGRSYVFKIHVSNTSNSFNLELKTTIWLQSNWQLLAIGAGAVIVVAIIFSIFRG